MQAGIFHEVVVVDTEFTIAAGERPVPVCLVAHELKSQAAGSRIFQGEFGPAPPYAQRHRTFSLSRILPLPSLAPIAHSVGLLPHGSWIFVEFRNRTNGLPTPSGAGLLGALTYFGLDASGAAEKKEMQEAIGNGTWRGRYTPRDPRLL